MGYVFTSVRNRIRGLVIGSTWPHRWAASLAADASSKPHTHICIAVLYVVLDIDTVGERKDLLQMHHFFGRSGAMQGPGQGMDALSELRKTEP